MVSFYVALGGEGRVKLLPTFDQAGCIALLAGHFFILSLASSLTYIIMVVDPFYVNVGQCSKCFSLGLAK